MTNLGRRIFWVLAALLLPAAISSSASEAQSSYPYGKGAYNGLVYSEEGLIPERHGFFKINTSNSGHFTGQIRIGSRQARFSDYFNGSGSATVKIKMPQDDHSYGDCDCHCGYGYDFDWDDDCPKVLVWTLELQVVDQGAGIHGRVTFERGTGWTSTLSGDRASYDRVLNPAPQAGRYTFILPGSTDPQLAPAGDSYGTMSVDAAGKVTLKATLANGFKIAHTATFGGEQAWPLYAPMHDGMGMVFGWISFAGAQTNGPAGPVHWVLPGREGINFYTAGFYLQTPLTASPFQARTPPVPGGGTASFVVDSGDGMRSTNTLAIDSAGRIVSTSGGPMTIKFSAQSGEFKGTVRPPGYEQTLRFGGMILQNRTAGFGYFLGERAAGAVEINPTD